MNNATRPNEGFLSSEISRSVSKIHDGFPLWFEVANSINELGMRILPLLQPVKTNDQQLLVAALYGRALTSFQSAYILAERGLTADARTVVRAAVETTVVLALKTGLLWLYNSVYRPTSGDSAHTSLQTLERHVQADEASEIQGLRFGPDVANVCDTLSAAISTLLPAIKASITLFHVPQFGPELDACTEAWKSLGIPPKNSVKANS